MAIVGPVPCHHLATLQQYLGDLTDDGGGEQDQAQGDAIEDTAERAKAYENLKEYMKELTGVRL